MTNGSTNDTPATPVADDKLKNVHPLLKGILLFFVIGAMLFIKPAKALWKRVYEDDELGSLLFGLGIASGIASGIGTGYYLGWVIGIASAKWVLWGLGVALFTFWYGWPTVYLVVLKQLFKLSSNLWELVPAADSRASVRDGVQEGWFSWVLLVVGTLATALGGVATFFHIAGSVHDKLGWGMFGYVPGGLLGVILAGLGGIMVWNIMRWLDMYFFAVLSAAVVALVCWNPTAAVLDGHGLSYHYQYAAAAIQGILWIAYGFPIAHLIVSFLGRQLARILENYDDFLALVYSGDKGGYREFYLHVVNIAVAGAAGYAVFHFVPMLALTALVSWTLVALAAIASYLLVGKFLLNCGGNKLVGLLVSGAVGYTVFVALTPVVASQAICGALCGVSIFVTAFVVYPAVYFVVRFAANPLLASWSRDLLVKAHDSASKEILHAFSNTYADETNYRDLFLHIANIATTIGVVFAGLWLGAGLDLALWLSVLIAAVLATTSYMLFGKLVLYTGSWLPSALVSLGLGIFAGAHALASLDYGWYAAVPVGLVAAAAMFVIGFPLTYVATRVVMNVLQTTLWLKPIVSGIWNTGWSFFANLTTEFVALYRAVDEWIRPYWASISKTWNDTWESVMETVRNLGGKK